MKWTEGRVKGFITSVLRAGYRKWPARFDALAKAKRGKHKNKATGRLAEHYECASCHKLHVAADVQVDHIQPVVSTTQGFVDWDTFIKRLYCSEDNLQILFLTCHKKKSEIERKERANK